MSFNYSIVIRTLGNTGEKYHRMLQAINNQTVKPREIIVVIPVGYELDYSLGNERIVHSDKGMVTQRVVGIEAAQSEYVLVLDDDLDFPPEFVERLYSCLVVGKLDCALAFSSWERFPNGVEEKQKKGNVVEVARKLRGAVTGQVYYSRRHSAYYDVITSTAGHRTYVNHPNGLCQTGCFQCFFIKTDKARAVCFGEERWLEQGELSQYAAYDDAVFFYKLYLLGGRIAYAQNTSYKHLDAAAGRPAKDKITSKRIRLYSISRNRTVFWYRFLWSNHRDLHTLFGGLYAWINYTVYNLIINAWPKYWPAITAMFSGYHDALEIIKNK